MFDKARFILKKVNEHAGLSNEYIGFLSSLAGLVWVLAGIYPPINRWAIFVRPSGTWAANLRQFQAALDWQSAILRNAAQPQPKIVQETHLLSFASAQEIVAK